MAYDEGLATRVRDAIGDRPGLAEKQMFGGLTFLVHGNDLRRCARARGQRPRTMSRSSLPRRF